MTDLGNPYQALGKETVRTSYEQSHKETCLKFSPHGVGNETPHWGGLFPTPWGKFQAYILVATIIGVIHLK